MRDYQSEKEAAQILPPFHLGEEVETPGGRGVVVSLSMPTNGLYLSPERSKVVVWFGTSNSKTIPDFSGKWTQFEFRLEELRKVEEK